MVYYSLSFIRGEQTTGKKRVDINNPKPIAAHYP